MNAPELFTVKEVAARVRVTPAAIRQRLRRGELGGFRIGTDWRIPKADLDQFIERNSNRPATGQPDDDEDAYWAAEADAALDRLARGEEQVITLEQWEARHGLGG